jgi:hypothetical protein
MKKSLIIALMLLSINVFSQDVTYHCYGINTGSWNGTDYNMGSSITDANYSVRMSNKSIVCNNTAGSVYMIINQKDFKEYSDRVITVWTGVDEEFLKCTIGFTKFYSTGHIQLWIYYSNMCIVFYLENQ